ncbi:hypothetical protein C1645_782943, partial [Glomus cerebriforme]
MQMQVNRRMQLGITGDLEYHQQQPTTYYVIDPSLMSTRAPDGPSGPPGPLFGTPSGAGSSEEFLNKMVRLGY